MSNSLVPMSGSPGFLPSGLSRGVERRIQSDLQTITADGLRAYAIQQLQHGLAMTGLQLNADLQRAAEQRAQDLAILHEQGRGLLTEVSILRLKSSAQAYKEFAESHPTLQGLALGLLEAQKLGAEIAIAQW